MYQEVVFCLICVYMPLLGKMHKKHTVKLKNPKKKLVYIWIFYGCTQSFEKKEYIFWHVLKRPKKCLVRSHIRASKKHIFTPAKEHILFLKILRANIKVGMYMIFSRKFSSLKCVLDNEYIYT
jgi:hypothetical protein